MDVLQFWNLCWQCSCIEHSTYETCWNCKWNGWSSCLSGTGDLRSVSCQLDLCSVSNTNQFRIDSVWRAVKSPRTGLSGNLYIVIRMRDQARRSVYPIKSWEMRKLCTLHSNWDLCRHGELTSTAETAKLVNVIVDKDVLTNSNDGDAVADVTELKPVRIPLSFSALMLF